MGTVQPEAHTFLHGTDSLPSENAPSTQHKLKDPGFSEKDETAGQRGPTENDAKEVSVQG